MGGLRMVALALIVVGVLALAYGGFTYTKATHRSKLGPIEISMDEKERVNVPVWAGVVAIVAGAGLLFTGGRKS